MINCLVVGAGGFVGAVLRYLIGLIPVKESFIFPIKTFAINLVGCFAIGLIAAVSLSKIPGLDPRVVLFLKVGLCGGFTTFSSFALETTDLFHGGHVAVAVIYVVLSILTGVGLVFLAEKVAFHAA